MDADSAPTFRFKRRKLAHARKPNADPTPADTTPQAIEQDAVDPSEPLATTEKEEDDVDPAVNLKDIIRQRRRPQDRMRDAARKAAERKADALALIELERDGDIAGGESGRGGADLYRGKFVAQTGQVQAVDDVGMAKYIEARLAEENHRKYGWPIPQHLRDVTATLTPAEPDNTSRTTTTTSAISGSARQKDPADSMAAGQGKLQEIDLGPEATAKNAARTEEARRRAEGLPAVQTEADDAESGAWRPGKRRRQPKRRNSDDLRRDMMVDAILQESKLEYFSTPSTTNALAHPNSASNPNPSIDPTADPSSTDEAFYEQFRQEYEARESKNARKPPPPPGPKDAPKGPKLGGSRSARAAMRAKEVGRGGGGVGGGGR